MRVDVAHALADQDHADRLRPCDQRAADHRRERAADEGAWNAIRSWSGPVPLCSAGSRARSSSRTRPWSAGSGQELVTSSTCGPPAVGAVFVVAARLVASGAMKQKDALEQPLMVDPPGPTTSRAGEALIPVRLDSPAGRLTVVRRKRFGGIDWPRQAARVGRMNQTVRPECNADRRFRLSARLPFDLRARGRGSRRAHHRPRPRRAGQRLHGGRDLRQGRALRRAHPSSRSPDAAAAADRREGARRDSSSRSPGTTRSISSPRNSSTPSAARRRSRSGRITTPAPWVS